MMDKSSLKVKPETLDRALVAGTSMGHKHLLNYLIKIIVSLSGDFFQRRFLSQSFRTGVSRMEGGDDEES